MRNPWLEIPLADYEGHMDLPHVDQLTLLADHLEFLVNAYAPGSLAIVGCAGGNGFDRVADAGVARIVGLDINPDYIKTVKHRYMRRVSGLEVHTGDIQAPGLHFSPVDLIYAGLLFEYVDTSKTLDSLRRHCAPNGILAVLLQLPHEATSPVSSSPYASLQQLKPVMHLVSPDRLHAEASKAGFVFEDSKTILSAAGKSFSSQVFRMAPLAASRECRVFPVP